MFRVLALLRCFSRPQMENQKEGTFYPPVRKFRLKRTRTNLVEGLLELGGAVSELVHGCKCTDHTIKDSLFRERE